MARFSLHYNLCTNNLSSFTLFLQVYFFESIASKDTISFPAASVSF